MQGYYQINPVTINVTPSITHQATKITMNFSYSLGVEQMPATYVLTGEYGEPYYSGVVQINAAELAQWGEDDMYIVNLVATKVGVTLV